jgi:hypothetical protein
VAAREMWTFGRKDPRKPVYADMVTVVALITQLVFLGDRLTRRS